MQRIYISFCFFICNLNYLLAQDTLNIKGWPYLINKINAQKFTMSLGHDYTLGSFEPIVSEDSLIFGYIFYDRTGEPDFPMYKDRNGEVLAIVNYKIGIPIKDTSLAYDSWKDSTNLKKITTYTEFIFPSKFLKAQLKGRIKKDSLLKIIYNHLYKYVPSSHASIYEFNNFEVESFVKINPPRFSNLIGSYIYKTKHTILKSGKRIIEEKKVHFFKERYYFYDLLNFIYIKKILRLGDDQYRFKYPDYWDQKNFELKVLKDWHRIANSDGIDEILAKYLK